MALTTIKRKSAWTFNTSGTGGAGLGIVGLGLVALALAGAFGVTPH